MPVQETEQARLPESGRRPGEETGSVGVCCGLSHPDTRTSASESPLPSADGPLVRALPPRAPWCPSSRPSHLPRAGAGAVLSAAPRTGASKGSPAVQSQAPGPAVSECRSWASPSPNNIFVKSAVGSAPDAPTSASSFTPFWNLPEPYGAGLCPRGLSPEEGGPHLALAHVGAQSPSRRCLPGYRL